jgi:toxin ParE1/3/4
MSSYLLTPEAQHDLNSISEYLTVQASSDRAFQVISDIRAEFEKLAYMPGMGHYREDLLDRRYKFWSVYSYVIAYRWETDPIRIIAVVHGARKLDAFFARRTREST